jgi:Flp pilus assembly protein TadD
MTSVPPASGVIARFEALLAQGKDNALLRFGLGSEYLRTGNAGRAAEHFQRAVELDANYSAAWKLLGKSLLDAGRGQEAFAAYQKGIVVAEAKGDKQAMKEMKVFAQRLAKQKGQE